MHVDVMSEKMKKQIAHAYDMTIEEISSLNAEAQNDLLNKFIEEYNITIVSSSSVSADTAKAQAEVNKLQAETRNIDKHVKWYEVVLFMGITTALLAAGKYLFN